MRTGLVIIGLVIVSVGAAVFLTVVLYPPMHTVSSITSSNFLAAAAPNGGPGSRAGVLPNEPQGSVVLFWIANASVGLSFYDSIGCHTFVNQTCRGTPIITWPQNSSGLYISPNSLACPCYAIPTNSHSYEVGINGYLVVTYPTTVPSLTEWSYAAVFFGSLILLVIGGLALFLGLFLRGHLFGGDPPSGPDGDEYAPGSDGEYLDEPAERGGGPTGPRTDYWQDEVE